MYAPPSSVVVPPRACSGDPTSLEACLALLDQNGVSAHYVIARDGNITSLVSESFRAWHSRSRDEPRDQMPFSDDSRAGINDFSIGIELITSGEGGDFLEPQYSALTALLSGICSRHPISAIVAHEHIAPGRKTDPGPQFDWQRIAAAVREWVSRDPTQSSHTPIRFSWEERVGKE